MNVKEFVDALELLEKEKGVSQKSIIEALELAIANGHQKEMRDINKDAIFRAKIDLETGEVHLWTMKFIVDEVMPGSESFEITLEDAKLIDSNAEMDTEIEVAIPARDDLSLLAISHVRQILRQKLREAERQAIYDQYSDKISDVILATVEKVERNFVTVDLGKTSAVMRRKDLIVNEHLNTGQTIKVYVSDVEGSGGSQITVSRTDPGLIRRLFEQEIHEIYDGTIIIKALVREAGFRTKIAVTSTNPNIDATGSCIGPRGIRVINVSSQINGEKIDVIEYFDDAAMFIIEAIKPAVPVGIAMSPDQSAIIIVKDADLSQAIGRNGINVRLASKITGWSLDVKDETYARNNEIEYLTQDVIKMAYFKKVKERARIELEERDANRVNEVKPENDLVVVDDYDQYISEDSETVVDDVEEVTPVIKPTPVTPVTPVTPAEPKVEKPIIIRSESKIKLSDLERQLEEERNAKPVVTSKKRYDYNKDKEDKIDKKEEEAKKLREEELARTYMPIYTEEELQELEEEELEEELDLDDDLEEYDTYYEDQ